MYYTYAVLCCVQVDLSQLLGVKMACTQNHFQPIFFKQIMLLTCDKDKIRHFTSLLWKETLYRKHEKTSQHSLPQMVSEEQKQRHNFVHFLAL